jgi:adenylosuccinate lyase
VRSRKLVEGMQFWPGPIARNLAAYGIFAATERVLMAAVKAGGDRQAMHEVIREHSMAAWAAVQAGKVNPLAELLTRDGRLLAHLSPERITELLDATQHVGDAPERTRSLAALIRAEVGIREVA